MTKKMLPVLAALVLALVFGINVRADTNGTGPAGLDPAMTIDAGWYGFCFGGPGSAATAGCQNAATAGVTGNDITFTATSNVLFNITDAFEKGDTFDVYINTVFAFTTDAVPIVGGGVIDPNAAFADPTYSHGSIELGPGSYTIDIFADASPYGGGGAYAEVVTPEPTSLLLLLTVIGSIGAGTRLKKRLS